MVDSSPSMASSPKHSPIPCLVSNKPCSSSSLVLPKESTTENPPISEISEVLSPSISCVPLSISSMEGQPVSLSHKVPFAGVISILKSSIPIKCNIESSKGEHHSSLPNNGGAGPSLLNTAAIVVAVEDLHRTPETSSSAAIIDNNGVFEGSYLVTPPKNVIGKKKGSTDQDDRAGKPTDVAPRPNQPFSTNGNAEKLASKGEACPSANVEGQLEDVPSLSNSELHHKNDLV
ncbi:hypothetical protein Q3G72_000543 [Acer saccharum]|nr:hypothetical protein Q3G72_000543 [Acer saccharum]